jgi:V/A-type H+-transporting ATPase subunit I
VSVEKMVMLNMIGHISDREAMCKKVVLIGGMHPINAFEEINTTDFTIEASEANKDALVEVGYIKPYSSMRDYANLTIKIDKIKSMSKNKDLKKVSHNELIFNYEELEAAVEEYYGKFEAVFERLKEKEAEKEKISKDIKHLEYIEEIDISLKELGAMRNFTFDMLKVSTENIEKLKHNYENIPSIVISVFKAIDYHVIMSYTPEVLRPEAERIFKSLNCEKIYIPMNMEGAPRKIIAGLNARLKSLKVEIAELDEKLKVTSSQSEKMVSVLSESVELEKLSEELKGFTAHTNEFFYMCGWITEKSIGIFKEKLGELQEKIVIIEKDPKEIENNILPPTKLSNNFFVKPFEIMVGMYGLPSYRELDPTTFLGISYMVTFGAMFGDVGQGLIFFMFGLYLKYFKGVEGAGGVLSRLGISSTIFGFLYGSIFGFEEIIEPVFMRPMENITEILIFAIIFGCILLVIGFAYSLVNSIKRKDLENGLFGKDGVAGLLFYTSILSFALSMYKGKFIFPNLVWISLFILLMGIMIFKEPLANLIQKKRPLYGESKGDYFIEEGFGVIETLLSMFSNTLSFIRVGAFALNHVGLFLAFSALAKMMKGSVGSILIYIIGNIIIIGLEGLIVFIQGLRLQYYELFSKYYEGSGIQFQPIKMSKEYINVEKIKDNKLIKNI